MFAGFFDVSAISPNSSHLDAEAMRLAREERARACGAQRVHGVVHGDAVVHADDLGILPAYLEDGAHVRMQVRRAHGVRGDLVLHDRGAYHRADEAPRAAVVPAPTIFILSASICPRSSAMTFVAPLRGFPSVHRYERARCASRRR